MKLRSSLIALALATFAGTAALADEITVATAQGDATVTTMPQTVVALDIAAVDTLEALGVQIAGIPAPHFVAYLDDVAAEAAVVGSLFEPDFEALANMAPDLIVAGGRSSTQVEPLSEIAPTIDMTVWGDGHTEQALARLAAYGAITGREAEAEALTDAFNTRLADAQAAVEGRGNAMIVLTNGPAVSAYGAGSRFGWLHTEIGLPEAVEGIDEQTHGEAISFEFIAEANPDWLIVVDRGAAIGRQGESAAQTLDNPLVAGTTAWQSGQVIYVNSAALYIAGGGIQSMNITLDEIIAAFGTEG